MAPYAAEHPEEHAAKEEIYESLMAGRISALDEKLAALGQTHEDYLPSEIEKFKDATGYEEFLDFDPTVIREAIQNSDKSHADEMLAFAEQAGREQMEAAGYGFHHQSDDGKYLIMGNGSRAFAIRNEEAQEHAAPEKMTVLVVGLSEDSFTSLTPEQVQKYTEHFKQPEQFISLNGQIIALPVEPENPLRTAEMTLEDDYGMIDGVLNNGRKGEELEKAQGEARRTTPEKKPSIRERLAEAKRECGERKPPDKTQQKKPPEHDL